MTKDKLVISREEVNLKMDTTTEKLDSGANLDLFYELEVRDKEGNLLSTRTGRSKSLLKNFALIIRALMAGNIKGHMWKTKWTVRVTLTARDGTTFEFPDLHENVNYPEESDSVLEASAIERNTDYGILVGTGSTPVTIDDYDIENIIPDGDGDGYMIYGKTTVEDVDTAPPDCIWRVIRTFSNSGSTTITVYEIGLAVRTGTKYVLIARDVLDTPQDVPAGATLTVRYVFKVTA